MRCLLQQHNAELHILEAGNFSGVIAHAESNPGIGLVLLGLNLPGSEAVNPVEIFSQRYPNIALVVIAESEYREDIESAMKSGARGYISKTTSGKDALAALRLIMGGGIYVPPHQSCRPESAVADKRKRRTSQHVLTTRQMEVLHHLGEGLPNKEISKKLGLSLGTTKVHIAAIYKSLKVSKRLEVLNAAQKLGLLS